MPSPAVETMAALVGWRSGRDRRCSWLLKDRPRWCQSPGQKCDETRVQGGRGELCLEAGKSFCPSLADCRADSQPEMNAFPTSLNIETRAAASAERSTR